MPEPESATAAADQPAATAQASKPTRLKSLDALRGFDMLWIIGLDLLFRTLAGMTESPALVWLGKQVHHVPWDGLRLYDLIFPTFVFISGVAIPYALRGKLDNGASKLKLTLHTLKRVVILIVLGMVYNGMLQFNWESLRVASVLGLIGISYGIAALVYLAGRSYWWRISTALTILLGVAALQLFYPVPDHGPGLLTREAIFNSWVDQHLLPGQLYFGFHDPEGLVCILSAGFLALLGCLAGELLHHRKSPQFRSVIQFTAAGATLLFLGWLCWDNGYPPIKSAWTSSFNLLAGGIALLLLAFFHLTIDFTPRINWSFPLQVIGMNPLTIYILYHILPFDHVSWFFFGGTAKLCGEWEKVVLIVGMLVVQWLLLLLFFRKHIFLRV
ncbi:acyltransferase family protein [Sulfuriroseicoccus oceanibius]|uniref:DUF5009 domain-containing protein n=1 Tax=Sulfuriroseicoccus oceanibius TaxID=2707525 RepID=A0A6B3LB06_9BACT|nr:DUF5009 domain-containing protein [Sulfuriroseicoccus oceanibius]QQL45636.1 DUF5009 domain-containing protein [Sulfuriroseicoccus oceanibius]